MFICFPSTLFVHYKEHPSVKFLYLYSEQIIETLQIHSPLKFFNTYISLSKLLKKRRIFVIKNEKRKVSPFSFHFHSNPVFY